MKGDVEDMKASLIGVVTAMSLCVCGGPMEFAAPAVKGHVHASTLLPLGETGDYLVAWFEGSKESARDVAIVGAMRKDGVWQPKRTLAKVNAESPHWNPVLRRGADGRIQLFFKVGRNCSDWRSYVIESRDEAKSWTPPRELVAGDVWGGRGPVKNKCLELAGGRTLAGASREFDPAAQFTTKAKWRGFVDISDDDGKTWRSSAEFPVPADAPPWGKNPFGVIQPTLWQDEEGVHALLRATDGWIWRTDSKDRGETWCEIYRTPLENVNSGIDCALASDGKLYLVMNGANRDKLQKGWGSRSNLDIRVSADGGRTWSLFKSLADDPSLRQPDGRASEYSYPAIVEARPGVLAVTFTWNRRSIAFVELPIRKRPMLVCNEDNDRYLVTAGETPGNLTPEGMRRYIDSIAAGGAVTHLFMCVNGQRTSFDSKTWEPIWLGLNDPNREGKTNNAWCVNAKYLHERDIDLWKIWIDRAREKGISPWISIRMNDSHFPNVTNNLFRAESRWYKRLDLIRCPGKPHGARGYTTDWSWDYSHAEVREHTLALIAEVLDRWDMDGLEIDWMRHGRHLTPGKEQEQGHVLTGVMREVRRLADAAEKRWGHAIKIGVRAPSLLKVAHEFGYEVEVWAREGFADLIVPTNFYAVPDFDNGFAEWTAAIAAANPKTVVLPGVDIGMGNGVLEGFIWRDPALVAGWAAVYAAQGSQGNYIFNLPYFGAASRRGIYAGALDPARLVRSRRRFPLTCHEMNLTHDEVDNQLRNARPAEGTTFRIAAAKGPYDTNEVALVIGYSAKTELPQVTLNGVTAKASETLVRPAEIAPGLAFAVRWKFPAEALKTGVNRVTVGATGDAAVKFLWAELALDEVK